MKKTNREQKQTGKPRRLVLSRETIVALDEPTLLELARGGGGFSGGGGCLTISYEGNT